jgi:hypothetical protein
MVVHGSSLKNDHHFRLDRDEEHDEVLPNDLLDFVSEYTVLFNNKPV